MNSEDQAKGERLVSEVLIEPLKKLGLSKPSTLTKVEFEEMTSDLCAKLAYMTRANLGALAEQISSNSAIKGRDRFPIANTILQWAGQIQPPKDDASPLIRAVFAGPIGADANTGGWAPELLNHLRGNRQWPGAYLLKTIKESAGGEVRRFRMLSEVVERGDELKPDDQRWRDARLKRLAKCRQISELGAC